MESLSSWSINLWVGTLGSRLPRGAHRRRISGTIGGDLRDQTGYAVDHLLLGTAIVDGGRAGTKPAMSSAPHADAPYAARLTELVGEHTPELLGNSSCRERLAARLAPPQGAACGGPRRSRRLRADAAALRQKGGPSTKSTRGWSTCSSSGAFPPGSSSPASTALRQGR